MSRSRRASSGHHPFRTRRSPPSRVRTETALHEGSRDRRRPPWDGAQRDRPFPADPRCEELLDVHRTPRPRILVGEPLKAPHQTNPRVDRRPLQSSPQASPRRPAHLGEEAATSRRPTTEAPHPERPTNHPTKMNDQRNSTRKHAPYRATSSAVRCAITPYKPGNIAVSSCYATRKVELTASRNPESSGGWDHP